MNWYKKALASEVVDYSDSVKKYKVLEESFKKAWAIKEEKNKQLTEMLNNNIPKDSKEFQKAQNSFIHSLTILKDYLRKLRQLKSLIAIESSEYDIENLDELNTENLDEIQLPDGTTIEIPYPPEKDYDGNIHKLETGLTGQLMGGLDAYDFDIRDEEEKRQLEDFRKLKKQ